ncbi:hypothetical protein FOPE_12579 [Fonsecaea pedrosoi]|nr:hypothetical protein FOPE_12579 [Fonsecaea pedrosoi]
MERQATTFAKHWPILPDKIALEENGNVGSDQMGTPRGILDNKLAGYDNMAMSWKLTGNLGGEDYLNRSRGPLNERSMYAERQG